MKSNANLLNIDENKISAIKDLNFIAKKIKKRLLLVDKLPLERTEYSEAIAGLSKEYRGLMESIININRM